MTLRFADVGKNSSRIIASLTLGVVLACGGAITGCGSSGGGGPNAEDSGIDGGDGGDAGNLADAGDAGDSGKVSDAASDAEADAGDAGNKITDAGVDSGKTDAGDAAVGIDAGDSGVKVDAGDSGTDAGTDGGDGGMIALHTVGGTLSGLGSGVTVTLLDNTGGASLTLSANGSFTFAPGLASGAAYNVTVSTPPAGQTCAVTNGSGTVDGTNVTNVSVACTLLTYSVGGTVSGLGTSGTAGLVLQDNGNDNVTVNANGNFTFPTKLTSGAGYVVSVSTQPAGLICSVGGGSGSISGANVTSVSVNCANDLFSIGGTISGLATGDAVTLLNGSNSLPLSSNGTFAFSQNLATGTAYAVTVSAQPTSPAQTCVVASGSGTVGSAAVTGVTVTCTTNTYSIAGSVTGLGAGDSLVVQDNGGDNFSVTAASPAFSFATPVASGATYTVTVLANPTTPVSQICVASQNTGTVAAANVTNVTVTCTTNTFAVGGTLTGFAAGGSNSVILEDNGGDMLPLTADGTFAFATNVASGSAYAVTVTGQPTNPAQTCTVSSGTGTVGNNAVTSVVVNCSNDYTIGGSVAGLGGGSVILQDPNAGTITVGQDGTFTLPTPLVSGSTYAVTVETQPSAPTQTCVVAGGTGTATADVTTVAVTCTTNTYKVGGIVNGLTGGESFTISNDGETIPIAANGNFVFPTSVASGQPYAVTVATNPLGPTVWETCTVATGSGTITSSDVQSVVITCAATPFAVGGTVGGLAGGDSVVLQDNGGNNLTVSANGTFTFTTAVASDQTYTVTVLQSPTAPVSQNCVATANTGTITSAAITTVSITCTTNSFFVNGTLTGMDISAGNTITLQDNGGDNKTLGANGAFKFATAVSSGAPYIVTVFSQPPSPAQTCQVLSGTGTVGSGDVTGIVVNCNTNAYTIGGNVSGLGAGDTVTLTDNGGDSLPVSANGSFTFDVPVNSADSYDVEVATNPTAPISQTCVATAKTGTVTNVNITNVVITCTTNTFAIGGTISGLAVGAPGDEVTLNDGVETKTFSANGPFAFTTSVDSGTNYDVEVTTQPGPPGGVGQTQQVCTPTVNTGTVGNAAVTSVVITCVTTQYSVSVNLNGMNTTTPVSIVLQDNGGDNITLTSNGTMAFPTLVNNNSPYAVTIATQPANTDAQSQVCNVVMGTETMPTQPVTVQVYCGRSCASLHAADPNAGDGTFLIDPDGTGPIATFQAYCLMLFDGGGWTLAESTDGGLSPSGCTQGVVTQNSCRYMPVGTVQALANLSTQVHVRDPVVPGDTPVDYVESQPGPDSPLIQNLRKGVILDDTTTTSLIGALLIPTELIPVGNHPFEEGLWLAPVSNGLNPADEPDNPDIFDIDCAVDEPWPGVYHACNHANAWHLDQADNDSKWKFSAGANIPLETYVR
jgi:hypothetical protein